ncbi:hypothetical protein [Accumulibacter sp.]|uniref:hypothetical protein n=1 Tax=Accumulibacter sp. TaxID=2053492 RepID=UPI0025F528A7|nr:hypothetical protein [Accumulibacter sp.]MCM8595011.1 hypothetical protein [Accumulibacter sp.]MDS4049157.1 hypothetical protein [Accumulibacter sp.]
MPDHLVVTAFEQGWSTLRNGEPLWAADREEFNLLITTDRRLQHQQNLSARAIGMIVLSTTSWSRIRACEHMVVAAVESARRSRLIEIEIP